MILRPNTSIFLDALRAVSAQLVLIGHLSIYLKIKIPYFDENTIGNYNIGVLIFFILSGFLIAFSIDSKQPTFQRYFIDRFTRIYSGFVPALLFVAVIDGLVIITTEKYEHAVAYNLLHFVGNLLMLQRFPLIQELCNDCLKDFGSGIPFWTLAVEWWLYCLYGYVLLGVRQYKWYVSVPLLLLFVISPFHHFKTNLALFWAMGVAIYFILKYSQDLKIKKWQIISLLLLFLAAAAYQLDQVRYAYDQTFGILLGIAFLFCMLLCQNSITPVPIFVAKLSKIAAAYSFTLYLMHYTCMEAIGAWLPHSNKMFLFVFIFIVSHLVAFVIAYFTEMRHQHLRNYFYKLY